MSKGAKYILIAFIAFAVISYFYTVFTGNYNGDHLGKSTTLNQWELFINLLYNILPYIVLFGLYKFSKRTKSEYKISVPIKLLGQFIFLIAIFQITVTALFGVGRMGHAIYEAPAFFKPFIQISNRIDLIFGLFVYGLFVDTKNKTQFILWGLILVLAIFKNSLGVFMFFAFYLVLKYHDYVFSFIKKRWLLTIFFLLLSPIIISILYEIRTNLRNEDNLTIDFRKMQVDSFSEVIFGKFIARLSSFSNSAFIIEKGKKIEQLARGNFTTFQYTKEALIPLYGKIIDSKITYSSIQNIAAGGSKYTSLMNGTYGSLLIGSYVSRIVFFVNLFTLLLLIIFTFFLSNFIRHDKIKEILFFFFCFNVLGGVSAHFFTTLFSTVLYMFLFLIFNSFKNLLHNR